MAKRVNFTVKFLESLKTTEDRIDYFDSVERGLGCTVFRSGTISFFWLRKMRGKPRRITIDRFPDISLEQARLEANKKTKLAKEWKLSEYKGPNPFDPKPEDVAAAHPITLHEAFEEYVKKQIRLETKNPVQSEHSRRHLYKIGLAKFGSRALADLRKHHAEAIRSALAEKGKKPTANRVIGLLKAIVRFTMGNTEVYSGGDFTHGIKPYPEEKRERYIKQSENAAFEAALEAMKGQDIADIVLMAVATGARKWDILSLKWSDVDFHTKTWRVPHPKSKDPFFHYTVELSKRAMGVLERRRDANPDPTWAFPNPKSQTGHISYLFREFSDFRKLAELGDDFAFHSLRHTFASRLVIKGASIPVVAKALGHTGGTRNAERYAHLSQKSVREAIESTEEAVAAELPKPRLVAEKAIAAKPRRKSA